MIQQEWFDKEGLKIIKDFPVLWQGWECDSKWYLCETESGKKVLVETNHGSPFISTVESLEEKINEYKEVLAETEEVMRILNESNNTKSIP